MTQGEQQLLLKDLSARLPYGVICSDSRHGDSRITEINIVDETVYCFDFDEYSEIKHTKPYLRPMSSMTEDEINEYENFITNEKDDQLRFCNELVFYNSHHLDYRGLIPKGLALEAPKDMYKSK